MKLSRTLSRDTKLNLASGALMLWIALGPWVWDYASSGSAVANHIFVIFSFGPLALLILALRPAAFVVLAAGVWLAFSPWILGYATNHSAWLSDGVTGILLSCVGASAAGISTSARGPWSAQRRHAAAVSRRTETAGSRS
ncbi:MAG TPA: SPW repeat protein [Thermoleophilaceae bacterium]|jgi:hypothetical protein